MKNVICVALLSGLLSLSAFDIVRSGKPCARLLISENLPREVVDAIKEFQRDIQLLTGADIPLTGEKPDNIIEVIMLEKGTADDDTVTVSFPANGVMRIESGKFGLLRIFPLLLERFAGVRYVLPTEKGTHYPPTENFVIPEKSFTHKPFFTYNRFLTWDDVAWQTKLGRKRAVVCTHDIPMHIFPIKQYIKTGQWPDKSVFPVVDGKRLDMEADPDPRKYSSHFQSDWQPCFTSPASIDEAVKNITAYLAEHPHVTSISLTPNDGAGYCECENCAKLDSRITPFRAYDRYKDHANSYYYWCNQIIQRLEPKFPELIFGSLAYRETHFVPDFPVHPKMLVYICIDPGWGLYPDVFDKLKQDIEQFAGIGAKVGVWDYSWGDSHYSLPLVYPDHSARMIRLLADNNYRAMFSEGCESLGEGPKRYLYLKLLEDPYADIEALKQEWYEACVGKKAAAYLSQYYVFWENFWRERASKTAHAENRHGLYQPINNHFGPYMNGLRKGDSKYLRELMDKVVECADSDGDERQRIRARWLYKAFEYYALCILISGGEILPDSGAVEQREEALELLRLLPEMYHADLKLRKMIEEYAADPELQWWTGMRLLSKKTLPKQYEYVLGKCMSYASDPEIYLEMQKIAKNKSLPVQLRMIAGTLSRYAESQMDNLLFDIPGGAALTGVHEIMLPVQNGEWLNDIPVSPGKYLVSVKVEIASDAEIPGEAWINLRLQGRNQFRKAAGGFLDSPKIQPKAGEKIILTNIYSTDERAAFLQIIVNLFHFKNGTKATISDLRMLRMDDIEEI